ncbi:MAG: DUF2281 domain-containing protein [Synergistaceae bacterium]|nr:DUF2281 domain-containing protein [Synergistaceae bacterium]
MALTEMQTQTVERRELYQMIEELPDNRIETALDFVRGLLRDTQAEQDNNFYNPTNIEWIKGSIEELRQGKVVVKTMEELEKMADG